MGWNDAMKAIQGEACIVQAHMKVRASRYSVTGQSRPLLLRQRQI